MCWAERDTYDFAKYRRAVEMFNKTKEEEEEEEEEEDDFLVGFRTFAIL
jgi:hypothetical protein